MLFSDLFTSTSLCKERPSFPSVEFVSDYHDTLVVLVVVVSLLYSLY